MRAVRSGAVIVAALCSARTASAGRGVHRAVRQHLRAHPGGDLRAPRLHQRDVSQRRGAGGRSRSVAGGRLGQSDRRPGAERVDRAVSRPRARGAGQQEAQPAVAQPRRRDAAVALAGAAAADAARRACRRSAPTSSSWCNCGSSTARRATASCPAPASWSTPACRRPKPLKIEPLPPPPPGVGVQIRAPRQVLPPQSERETCFVSYYDVTDQVPAEFRGPGGDHLPLQARRRPPGSAQPSRRRLRLPGATPIDDPVWGPFTCQGGARDGQPCAPKERDACGADAICASPPRAGGGVHRLRPRRRGHRHRRGEPVQHHGQRRRRHRGHLRRSAAAGHPGVELARLQRHRHAGDARHVGQLRVRRAGRAAAPARALRRRLGDRQDERAGLRRRRKSATTTCCRPTSRVLELTSHTHKRGKRFRVFEGDFRCQRRRARRASRARRSRPTPVFPVPDLCAGAPCVSRRPPRAGDCNGDHAVSIDELIAAVNIALNRAAPRACPDADADGSGSVTVAELIARRRRRARAALRDPRREPALHQPDLRRSARPVVQPAAPLRRIAIEPRRSARSPTVRCTTTASPTPTR